MPRFSITKWIHLHGGDDGLLEFFRQVYRLLVPGGIFVLEPQEWEGYKKAKRVDRVSRHLWLFQTSVAKWSQKLAENARRLKLRPEMFEEELAKIGLTLEEAYGTPGEGGMYPTLYIQVHSTLTAKQVLNALCMLIANRHERRRFMHNPVPIDRNCGSKRAIIRGERQVLADQERPSL